MFPLSAVKWVVSPSGSLFRFGGTSLLVCWFACMFVVCVFSFGVTVGELVGDSGVGEGDGDGIGAGCC